MSTALDLLALVDALVRVDPHPPGFAGKLALGLFEGGTSRWLLLHFRGSTVELGRSEGPLAANDHDCVWLVAASSESRLPTPEDPVLQRGDAELLHRFSRRYFTTRTRLGLQIQNLRKAQGGSARRGRRKS